MFLLVLTRDRCLWYCKQQPDIELVVERYDVWSGWMFLSWRTDDISSLGLPEMRSSTESSPNEKELVHVCETHSRRRRRLLRILERKRERRSSGDFPFPINRLADNSKWTGVTIASWNQSDWKGMCEQEFIIWTVTMRIRSVRRISSDKWHWFVMNKDEKDSGERETQTDASLIRLG